jgi:site-specific DNA-methyltransferase (adenine-specific)
MAKKRPLKVHEDILVFASRQTKYNPQMTSGKPYSSKGGGVSAPGVYRQLTKNKTRNSGTRYPRSVLKVNRDRGLHPTQKPVALFEYLIKTYTDQGDFVLDNCAGSGTTGVACINTQRDFLLIEKESEYVEIARKRIGAIRPKK